MRFGVHSKHVDARTGRVRQLELRAQNAGEELLLTKLLQSVRNHTIQQLGFVTSDGKLHTTSHVKDAP